MAVIIAVPRLSAVIRPVDGSTSTTAGLLVDHTTGLYAAAVDGVMVAFRSRLAWSVAMSLMCRVTALGLTDTPVTFVSST